MDSLVGIKNRKGGWDGGGESVIRFRLGGGVKNKDLGPLCPEENIS